MEILAFLLFDSVSFSLGLIFLNLKRCWGFLNLIVFWILIPEKVQRNSLDRDNLATGISYRRFSNDEESGLSCEY